VNGEFHTNTAESFNANLGRAKQGVSHYLADGTFSDTSVTLFSGGNIESRQRDYISKNGIYKIICKAKHIH
jgi:hypothetical protein